MPYERRYRGSCEVYDKARHAGTIEAEPGSRTVEELHPSMRTVGK